MKRHIILADSHGDPAFVERVLCHSGYNRGKDLLIHAGDTADIGKRGKEVVSLILAEGGTVMLGNHEFAHIIGDKLSRGNGGGGWDSSLDWKHGIPSLFGEMLADGRMPLAYDAGGVLVSHAGLSLGTYRLLSDSLFGRDSHPGIGEFVAAVNSAAIEFSPSPPRHGAGPYWRLDWDRTEARLFGNGSMLWYRPDASVHFGDWAQIAGHTPPGIYGKDRRAELEASGFHLVDPYDSDLRQLVGYVRYAVVVGGHVSVVTDWSGRE